MVAFINLVACILGKFSTSGKQTLKSSNEILTTSLILRSTPFRLILNGLGKKDHCESVPSYLQCDSVS